MRLENSFHGTAVTISDTWVVEPASQAGTWTCIQYQADWRRDPAAIRVKSRIEKALCGTQGCQCGTVRA